MTLIETFQRYWVLSVALALATLIGVGLLEQGGEPSYTTSGTVMIAPPEVDPSRAAPRAVNLASAIAQTATSATREAIAADGGRDDYRIIQVNQQRAQVLATGDGAVPAVRAVLRALSDVVAAQQVEADVDTEDRIRPRMFVQIPDDDLDALGAIEGSVAGEPPEVVGTLVLENPLAGAKNPLGGTDAAARLVLLRINSDDGSEEIRAELAEGAGFSLNAFDRRAPDLLTITTRATTPRDALSAFDVVSSAVETELDRRQEVAGVPSQARLLIDVIAKPVDATEEDGGLSSSALALLVLGLGTAVAAPTLLRELSQGRSRDRSPEDGQSSESMHTPPQDPFLSGEKSGVGAP